MSKERVELAKIVNLATYEDGLPTVDYEILEQAADAILAAGYRKPRVVESAEELDALPEGSVILSDGGKNSAQKDDLGYWYLWGGDIGLVSAEIMLPATVLHVGAAK